MRRSIWVVLAFGLYACNGDDSSAPPVDASHGPDARSDAGAGSDAAQSEASSDAGRCSTTVDPSADGGDDRAALQLALIDAQSGDTICFGSGRFHVTGQLSLDVDNVTVRGQADTVLDFTGQTSGANSFEVTADHVTIDTLRIENPHGDGLRATAVDFVTFRNVHVEWTGGPSASNGGYAIYPVTSSHVLVENCFASGASDTGIYVGQSNTIIIRNNEATGNVAGIEIENSTDAEVYGNHSHGNSGGILIFNLPNLSVKDGKRANVHDNVVEANNLTNFAAPGGLVGTVPTGTGMFILSADDNEIHANTVQNNQSLGIAVVSWFVLMQDSVGHMDPMFDFYPERNNIHDNMLSNNGSSPQGTLAQTILALLGRTTLPDLTWDGIFDTGKADGGTGDADAGDAAPGVPPYSLINCFKSNGSASFGNLDIGSFPSPHPSYDVTPYECDRPPLPAITF